MFFYDGQIVMDFRHNRILVWNQNQHKHLIFSCRAATEYEINLFKKFKKNEVKFTEIDNMKTSEKLYLYHLKGNSSKWEKREKITVPVTFTRRQINIIERLKFQHKLNFNELLDLMIRYFDFNNIEITNELNNIKTKYNNDLSMLMELIEKIRNEIN